MGKFTDGKPLPETPPNGMPGITSSIDNDYGEYEGIQAVPWRDISNPSMPREPEDME